jgi:hypothetical protein
MILRNSLVKETSIAALFVILGVVIKNSIEQLGAPNHPIGAPLGMMFFVLGWIYTAYILSVQKPNKMLFVLASAGVLFSVIIMKKFMSKNKTPPMIFPTIFSISWIALGLLAGNHLSGSMKYVGLVASVLVLLSMLMVLPMQRKKKVIDGPGMPMFVIAWVILVFVNSSR